MSRRLNKMTIGEAFCILGFKAEDKITKKIIMQKFHKLVFQYHTDKNPDKDPKKLTKQLTKVVEAKEVLMRDFDTIATTTLDEKGKSIKSVGSVFVDWLKTADTKNIKNPFTTYRKGRTK